MNWVAADLPARFRRGHSRLELFATDGLLTGRQARLRVQALRNGWRGTRDPDRANNGLDRRDAVS